MDLAGKRVLVVEDEFLVALGLEEHLKGLGCQVVGPVPSLAEAEASAAAAPIDAAILDIHLGEEEVFPAAAILAQRGIPFLFCSGDVSWAGPLGASLPDDFDGRPCVLKPYTGAVIVVALQGLLCADAAAAAAAPMRVASPCP